MSNGGFQQELDQYLASGPAGVPALVDWLFAELLLVEGPLRAAVLARQDKNALLSAAAQAG